MPFGKRVRAGLILVALGVVAALLFTGSTAIAKKPDKPPPDPEPDPDPAIAYRLMDDDGQKLMVMNADGSNQTVVLNVGDARLSRPEWSPDGEQIAFGSDLDGNMGIYIIDLEVGAEPELIVDTDSLPYPIWSPGPVPGVGDDAYRLAYVDKDSPDATWEVDLFLVKPDGTDRVRLDDFPNDGTFLSWSPDATKLAFAETNTRGLYCILDFANSVYTYTHHQFTGALASVRPLDLRWSKTQSDKLAFGYPSATYEWDVYILDLDDPTTATRLTDAKGIEKIPCWSSDDASLVFEVQPKRNAAPSIAVTSSTDGSSITTIQKGGIQPTWRR